MKYLLFDLSVTASFVVLVVALIRPLLLEDPQRMTTPPASSIQHDDQENQHHFKVGDIVEMYHPDSFFAMPVTVRGYKKPDDTSTIIKYDLNSAIFPTKPTGVAPQFIHPYQVYKDGTLASCNIGGADRTYMTPCKILSHVIKKKSGFVSYQIEYLKREYKEGSPEYLPFSRVQRHLTRDG